MVTMFPKSLHHLRNFFKLTEEFTRFVVCRKCYSVQCSYNGVLCGKAWKSVEQHGTSVTSKLCSFAPIQIVVLTAILSSPLLLKTVKLLGNKVKLYPFKVFCYSGFLLVLLICVTIGALEQILTAHFKTYFKTFTMSKWPAMFSSSLIGFSHINSPNLLLELYI